MPGFDEVLIEEIERQNRPLRLASRSDDLLDFLEREQDDDPKGNIVFLADDDSLFLSDPAEVLYLDGSGN